MPCYEYDELFKSWNEELSKSSINSKASLEETSAET